VLFGHVVVQIIPGEKHFGAEFTRIGQCSREMDILYMLLQVASVSSYFATQSAFPTFGTKTQFLDKISRENNTGAT